MTTFIPYVFTPWTEFPRRWDQYSIGNSMMLATETSPIEGEVLRAQWRFAPPASWVISGPGRKGVDPVRWLWVRDAAWGGMRALIQE